MAVKRKSILDLDAIENTRQREVAKVVRAYLLERNLSNKDLADLSGISASTVANIFRRQAKSLPSANALQSIAIGLSTGKEGDVDEQKARSLYKKLMYAADYDLNSNPFTFQTGKKRKLTKEELEGMTLSRIKRQKYRGKLTQMTQQPEKMKHFDAWVEFLDCPYLEEWHFMFSFNAPNPYVYIGYFLCRIYDMPDRTNKKYSIVTNHEEIYVTISQLDFSGLGCFLSVIIASEDGHLEERYLKTGLSHEELDRNGLTFQ